MDNLSAYIYSGITYLPTCSCQHRTLNVVAILLASAA